MKISTSAWALWPTETSERETERDTVLGENMIKERKKRGSGERKGREKEEKAEAVKNICMRKPRLSTSHT